MVTTSMRSIIICLVFWLLLSSYAYKGDGC